jgi:hypothetical protein
MTPRTPGWWYRLLVSPLSLHSTKTEKSLPGKEQLQDFGAGVLAARGSSFQDRMTMARTQPVVDE